MYTDTIWEYVVKLGYLSFRYLRWIRLSLKELPSAVMVSCRGRDWLSIREDSFALTLLCPTTPSGSRGCPRTEPDLRASTSALVFPVVDLEAVLLAPVHKVHQFSVFPVVLICESRQRTCAGARRTSCRGGLQCRGCPLRSDQLEVIQCGEHLRGGCGEPCLCEQQEAALPLFPLMSGHRR